LGTYLVVKSLYLILNSEIILNGTGYAHFGGMIGGVAVFIWYKLKKGIV
jgi:membrane associated rhomboid family serine protease